MRIGAYCAPLSDYGLTLVFVRKLWVRKVKQDKKTIDGDGAGHLDRSMTNVSKLMRRQRKEGGQSFSPLQKT